jgi:hypothetical protein
MSTTILSPDEFLAPFPQPIQALAQELRTLVKCAVPNNVERVYPGWRLIGYCAVSGRKTYYFCFVAPLLDHVRLGFEYGVELSIIETYSKAMEHKYVMSAYNNQTISMITSWLR